MFSSGWTTSLHRGGRRPGRERDARARCHVPRRPPVLKEKDHCANTGSDMAEPDWLADQFEHWRPHLASVAYGMLGSVTEAQDAVQQAWLRLGRTDADAIADLRAWL